MRCDRMLAVSLVVVLFIALGAQAPSTPEAIRIGVQLPLSGDVDEYGVHVESRATGQPVTFNSYRYAVSPTYLSTLGIPLRRGRAFDERDRDGAPRVAPVSESLARDMTRRAGTDNAIGMRLRIGPMDSPEMTVVGIVGDVRQASLAKPETDAVYVPESQFFFVDRVISLVVRTSGDPASLAPAVLPLVLGPEWQAMVAPFQLLMLAGVAQGALAIVRQFLVSSGSVRFCTAVDAACLVATARSAIELLIKSPIISTRSARSLFVASTIRRSCGPSVKRPT